MPIKANLKSSKGHVSLNWTQLDAVVAGISAIDIQSLAIRTREDARLFAQEYGFNLDHQADYEHITQVHQEAVDFIEDAFLDPDQYHLISEEVRNPEHVLDLLVYASNQEDDVNVVQMWACAVLKVMHAIFHIDHDLKLRYFDHIRNQIFDALDRVIVQEGPNFYMCEDTTCIPLFFFEKKRNKGRKSILLKLLQKPSYVASDIYDHLGIRLIFETKMECLFALKVLRRSHLLTVTNIKPFRSRNNMIDLEITKALFEEFEEALNQDGEYPREVLKEMDRRLNNSMREAVKRENNPHSSADFQTIQVTARKMVRIPNPAYETLLQLKAKMESLNLDLPPELASGIEADQDLPFYFDYEIQIQDKASYLKSMHGPASHSAYKKRQVDTARKRILAPALWKYIQKEGAVVSD